MALSFLVATGMLAFGEACRVGHIVLEPSRRWPWSNESLGYLALATGFAVAVLALGQLLQPSRLILTAEELVHEKPWNRRSWKWPQISAFRIEEDQHHNLVIRFDHPIPRPGQLESALEAGVSEIPEGWTIGLDEVCARLNAARDRWQSPP